jgi:hypothetical protein
MKTDGKHVNHSVDIPCKLGEPIKIIPFGDVHRDSEMHAHSTWQDFLAYAKAQKNAYFLGMGDYTDGISTSERAILNASNLHSTTKISMGDMYKGVVRTLANELGFMRHRCIGLLGGNHYFDYNDGQNTDHLLAAALGTRHLGVHSFILVRLMINERKTTSGRPRYVPLWIQAHHGLGGGALAGSQYNPIQKMGHMFPRAHINLMGHSHGKGCNGGNVVLVPREMSEFPFFTIDEQPSWQGRTGSFLKVYEDGKSSYNVDACRSPNALGWIEFEVTPRRITTDGHDRLTLSIRGTS